ncbi:hypothetical protein FHS29_007339 [Saccharothrix tamanrassetensis]|uniref:diacylglycerol O-acyltransferase n=1 Tax=Saccharothrix tamanrassetensis TaxID=1051531 RepID=A0A841CSF3_9PSEU|nr:wax ester/triacylglycerol synthase domain-containing protein [Saccharothrix tamanrassetensis]MBB5960711.1 hypothetical protein [Saccharothrix tamanrassetensis]
MAPLDGVFWRLRSDPVLKPVVVALFHLDGVTDPAQLREWHERTLLTDPRFSSRVGGTDRSPRWEPDPAFTLDDHVVRVPLAGAEASDQLVRELVSAPFTRDIPPWRAYVIDNPSAGTSLYLLKLTHAMADGLRIVELITGRRAPATRTADDAPAGNQPPTLRPLDRIGRWARLVKAVAAPSGRPRHQLSGARRHTFFEVPLAGLKAAGTASGGTLNHALLAALTRGISRYRERTEGRRPTALAALSAVARSTTGATKPANDFIFVHLTLPVVDDSVEDHLRAVRAAIRSTGDHDAVDWLGPASAIAPLLPTGLIRAGLKHFSASHDFVVSNIPAGRSTIAIGGRRVTAVFGVTPLSAAPMTITLVSYQDTCHITLNTDPAAGHDLPALVHDIRTSLQETIEWGVKRLDT